MPECYADTLLIETLVPTKNGYNHKHNCFKVESEMARGKLMDKFALGIIDNDKKAIKYLGECEVINNCGEDLILWKHKEKNHFIIQICPALEIWILKVCAKAGINLQDYELQNSLESFKRITKSMSSLEDKKLKRLFAAIKATTGIEEVETIIRWVTVLKEKNYRVELQDLV